MKEFAISVIENNNSLKFPILTSAISFKESVELFSTLIYQASNLVYPRVANPMYIESINNFVLDKIAFASSFSPNEFDFSSGTGSGSSIGFHQYWY